MESNFNSGFKKTVAYLHFEDGTSFIGFTNKAPNDSELTKGVWGEAAFTTGMSGYQETMSDPSFLGQHIIFTNAHIGNYASDERVLQSNQCFATSIIARNFTENDFLSKLTIPLFFGLDTRKLVRFLTSKKAVSHKSVLCFSEKRPSQFEFDKGVRYILRKYSLSNSN